MKTTGMQMWMVDLIDFEGPSKALNCKATAAATTITAGALNRMIRCRTQIGKEMNFETIVIINTCRWAYIHLF